MRRPAVSLFAASAAIALCGLLLGCGEKEENLDVVPETEVGLEPVPPVPEASQVQVGLAAAEQLARQTATAKVDPDFKIAPDAWQVDCKDPKGDLVTCSVSSGPCSGSVIITPTKVPAGESAEGYVPRGDGSRVKCVAPKASKKKPG